MFAADKSRYDQPTEFEWGAKCLDEVEGLRSNHNFLVSVVEDGKLDRGKWLLAGNTIL